ncbi:MAG: hypothetical protein FJ125_07035 [Deltaproteobacteria bacterium]|nr:hypothetical protein [Deltaproteobacteria bacterium]
MAAELLEAAKIAGLALGAVLVGMVLILALLYLVRAAARLGQRGTAGSGSGGSSSEGASAAGEGADAAPEEQPGVLLAVLAAAAATALGRSVRIHRVHLHREPERDVWSRAGRMDIILSHRLVPGRDSRR